MTVQRIKCICEWEDGCGGTGVIYCAGCGGDQCVCQCGGELPCGGCEECDFFDDDDICYDEYE